ncbi:hypothetical protein ABZS66_49525 [Dactylosporangium sp. NPDC005572]|uniref:hypothetical protein n=1 Tax=Dactylosporangium sp. NPDC005572 TaxID=3156889 RepID=UPI0033A9C298
MLRKKSRWFGGALMAMVLTVAGLVAAPGAAQAASPITAFSADDYMSGYAWAAWSNTGQYSTFKVCDDGAPDGHRAVGYISWEGGPGTISRQAAGGTGTCSTPVNVFIPAGKWVKVRACERNGPDIPDLACGSWRQGIAGS